MGPKNCPYAHRLSPPSSPPGRGPRGRGGPQTRMCLGAPQGVNPPLEPRTFSATGWDSVIGPPSSSKLRFGLLELGGPVMESHPVALKVLGSKPKVGSPRIFKIYFHQQNLSSLSIACDIKQECALFSVFRAVTKDPGHNSRSLGPASAVEIVSIVDTRNNEHSKRTKPYLWLH